MGGRWHLENSLRQQGPLFREKRKEAKREKKEEYDKWKDRMKHIEEMLRWENENIHKELEQERAKGNRK
jgi:hypothetical protein